MSFLRYLLLLSLLICFGCVNAQKVDSLSVGQLDGVVRDSVHNYVLRSATVAVYRQDSVLVSYQLTNNFGEYHFKSIPIGEKLKVVASFKNYNSEFRDLVIDPKVKELKLSNINLARAETKDLEEVVVKSVPPIRMNGDTLEFNADAFRLDKNAVVEDLLKKLPGIVVWGDGTITVNGREVSGLKVDGKPFMGGNTKVATQNIPKDAVDKIQVYQQRKNDKNPLDSITEVNIKLKKNKNFGHFGKLGAGEGTHHRYAHDANNNFFNPKTQLVIAGEMNNVNKSANSASNILEQSTFKGVGANIDYQPDFSLSGENKAKELGATFQHDFIPDADFYKNNRLDGNYFYKNSSQNILNTQRTILAFGGDSIQTQLSNSQNYGSSFSHNLSSTYSKHKDNYSFNSSIQYNNNRNNINSSQESAVYDKSDALQSTNTSNNEGRQNGQNINMQLQYNVSNMNYLYGNRKKWHPNSYGLTYAFTANDNSNYNTQKTVFNSIIDPSQNSQYNRRYDNDRSGNSHKLSFNFDNLHALFFSNSYVNAQFYNTLVLNNSRQNNRIADMDTTIGQYVSNEYLSVQSRYRTIQENPAIAFSKNYYKGLTNRYQKSLNISLRPEAQYFSQKNNSNHEFQVFTKDYIHFVPSANLTYSNNQYGAFDENISLGYKTSIQYPTVDQLFPLVDSVNSYYLSLGNNLLRPATDRSISLSYSHNSLSSRKNLRYNIGVSGHTTSDGFVDSSYTDELGRTRHYTINASGYRSMSINGSLNKAFLFKTHQIQLQYNGSMGLGHSPNNINGVWNLTNSFNHNNNLFVFYSHKDWLALQLKENYTYYQSTQKGLNNTKFSNSFSQSVFSASVNCSKRVTLNSNITYNHSTSSGSNAVDFTIWNANAILRLLSGNNLECKLSALDLLHQNTNVLNAAASNRISQNISNVLQQYFMVTIAYFPKQFGKKEK